MIPDPRQQISCDKSHEALTKNLNTIFVGPTGSGKTAVFCNVIKRFILENKVKHTLVIAHTDEITSQNINSFQRVYPEGDITLFNAKRKEWECNPLISFNCQEKNNSITTFGMVQSVARRLSSIPKIDLLAIDECHHVPASSYQKIIKAVKKKNPNVMIYGVTATPMRTDKVGLFGTFDNVCDQVSVAELIISGRLVQPVTYIKDIGVNDKLMATRKTNGEFDQEAVCDVMNLEPLNTAVVNHWRELASDRQTVVFCSTVKHAKDMAKAFNDAGERAGVVWGTMDIDERLKILKDYEDKKLNILTNVSVLIEGWDSPQTSCILLLRPCSSKTTMVQMVGRGLRPLESGTKLDCIIGDFGITTQLHGTLEQDVDIEAGRKAINSSLSHKLCPECNEKLSRISRMCKRCGYKFTVTKDPVKRKNQTIDLKNKLRFFSMVEINLLRESRFSWVDLTKNKTGNHILASGMNAWASVFMTITGEKKKYHAIGGRVIQAGERKGKKVVEYLMSSSRKVCLARANRYLYTNEDTLAANKSREWLTAPVTVGQLRLLIQMKISPVKMTRYDAVCWIRFKQHKKAIFQLLKENR